MAAREHRHRAAAARTQRRVELEHFPITLNRLVRTSRVTGVPPIATKIFLLAVTSCETRCQWPMLTPASLNGACCATAVPVASVDASHNPAIRFFMNASLLRHRLLIGGLAPCCSRV